MKVAVFSTKPYDEEFLRQAAPPDIELEFFEARLIEQTAPLARGFSCVCVFVNDVLDGRVLGALAEGGCKLIALRCAGFNNVDLLAAHERDMAVVRVPAYSPHAVAEHTVGLMLALNRKIHRAYRNVRNGNLSLNGLLGFDLRGRRVGIVGQARCDARGACWVESPERLERFEADVGIVVADESGHVVEGVGRTEHPE